jgi:hypothetical protein
MVIEGDWEFRKLAEVRLVANKGLRGVRGVLSAARKASARG